jgi:hypothetical protein
MKLPQPRAALIPEAKLVEYLLSLTHRRGRSKAVFFTAYGFSRESWPELAEALRKHAQDHDIREHTETAFGTRYIIDGVLLSPTGQSLQVRVAWFIDKGKSVPRFITAHPLKRKRP